MLKSLTSVVLIAGSLGSLAAEEKVMAEKQVPKPILGFEFGASANLFSDNRFEGNATNFALAYQVSRRIQACVYHEQGHIHGEENNTDINIDVNLTEFRVGLDIWSNEGGSQEVALMVGIGQVQYTEGITASEGMADIAVRYSPIRVKSGPVIGTMNLNFAYRYSALNNLAIAGFTRRLEDLGGFVIGLGAGVHF
jgi:hypothetical protein